VLAVERHTCRATDDDVSTSAGQAQLSAATKPRSAHTRADGDSDLHSSSGNIHGGEKVDPQCSSWRCKHKWTLQAWLCRHAGKPSPRPDREEAGWSLLRASHCGNPPQARSDGAAVAAGCICWLLDAHSSRVASAGGRRPAGGSRCGEGDKRSNSAAAHTQGEDTYNTWTAVRGVLTLAGPAVMLAWQWGSSSSQLLATAAVVCAPCTPSSPARSPGRTRRVGWTSRALLRCLPVAFLPPYPPHQNAWNLMAAA